MKNPLSNSATFSYNNNEKILVMNNNPNNTSFMNNNNNFNNSFIMNNNPMLNTNMNNTQSFINNNDYNQYSNYMGINNNNNMNMNMFYLMMNYLNQYYAFMNNNKNNFNNNQFNTFCNNNNFNRMSFVNNNNYHRQSSSKTLLPRFNIDNFSPFGNEDNQTNIFFQTAAGHKINMILSINTKMKDALLQYVKRIGLEPESINKDIYFLYSGQKIKSNENRTIYQMGMLNGAIIIVIDVNEVMGA